jgi:hypothetical protein
MTNAREALWLAQRMGLPEATLTGGVVDYVESVCYGLRNYSTFTPHTDKAQFAEVWLWAVKEGLPVQALPNTITARYALRGEPHDNTDAGIMAATITAICRATGFNGEENGDL